MSASSLAKAFSPALREIRILCSQTGPASEGTRCARAMYPRSAPALTPAPCRQFIQAAYPALKKANPDLPVLIREARGTPARVFARFGAPRFAHSLARVCTDAVRREGRGAARRGRQPVGDRGRGQGRGAAALRGDMTRPRALSLSLSYATRIVILALFPSVIPAEHLRSSGGGPCMSREDACPPSEHEPRVPGEWTTDESGVALCARTHVRRKLAVLTPIQTQAARLRLDCSFPRPRSGERCGLLVRACGRPTRSYLRAHPDTQSPLFDHDTDYESGDFHVHAR
jgi:hypothetical protein